MLVQEQPYFFMMISKLALMAMLLSGKGIILHPLNITSMPKGDIAATAKIHTFLLAAAAA